MKRLTIPILILSAIAIGACSPLPATGGLPSGSIPPAVDYANVPIPGESSDMTSTPEVLPYTGGLPQSNADMSASSNLSLSDEALKLESLGTVLPAASLGSLTDISLSDEAIALQFGDLASLKD